MRNERWSPAASPGAGTLLVAQAAALWPHWLWYARRMMDGSDEPWGLLALLTVGALVLRDRRRLVARPAQARVLSAAFATLAAAVVGAFLPPLLAAAVAMLAVAALLAGLLPADRPAGGLVVLLLLSLPVIASLQFFAGYPLRRLTAMGAAALLRAAGLPAGTQGAAIVWHGGTVLVDAPCAGIAMLWVGAYLAALLSYVRRASTGRCLANLAAAVALVLAANVVRNTLLFFPEAGLVALPGWSHEAIGLSIFALAVWPICRLVAWRPYARRTLSLLLFLAAALAPFALRHWKTEAAGAAEPPAVEWPSAVDGRPLTQLPLTAVEHRFARRFPGRIGRFSDGGRTWILRAVHQPSRRLHPAADCFKGLGYAVQSSGVHTDREGQRWGCFRAVRDGSRLRVCERIHDDRGRSWTDVSSWYWAALFAGHGPWWAVTVVSAE